MLSKNNNRKIQYNINVYHCDASIIYCFARKVFYFFFWLLLNKMICFRELFNKIFSIKKNI